MVLVMQSEKRGVKIDPTLELQGLIEVGFCIYPNKSLSLSPQVREYVILLVTYYNLYISISVQALHCSSNLIATSILVLACGHLA